MPRGGWRFGPVRLVRVGGEGRGGKGREGKGREGRGRESEGLLDEGCVRGCVRVYGSVVGREGVGIHV